MSARETIRNVLLVHYADSPNPELTADTLMANARREGEEDVLVVTRFDTAIEPAPEEEQVLTIGAIADDGRPVGLLLDEETRRKVAGWLAPADDAEAYDGEVAMLRSLVRTLRVVIRDDASAETQRAEVRKLLWEHAADDAAARDTNDSSRTTSPTPADTNRRARLLFEMSRGGRWKSGDVLRWYQDNGITGLGTRAARHDLAVLRDSGRIHQHDEKGVRYFTADLGGNRG